MMGLAPVKPMPRVLAKVAKPEVSASPALSLFARPGDGSLATRRVAILVADGVDLAPLKKISQGLEKLGAVVRYVGARLGTVTSARGEPITVDVTLETSPGVLYDAAIVPGGKTAIQMLASVGQAPEFLKDQYRHCKPLLVIGEGSELLQNGGIPLALSSGASDPGLILCPEGLEPDTAGRFAAAIAKHRHFDRALDPPRV